MRPCLEHSTTPIRAFFSSSNTLHRTISLTYHVTIKLLAFCQLSASIYRTDVSLFVCPFYSSIRWSLILSVTKFLNCLHAYLCLTAYPPVYCSTLSMYPSVCLSIHIFSKIKAIYYYILKAKKKTRTLVARERKKIQSKSLQHSKVLHPHSTVLRSSGRLSSNYISAITLNFFVCRSLSVSQYIYYPTRWLLHSNNN